MKDTPLHWVLTYPETPGHYWFKAHELDRIQVVEVYENKPPYETYGWDRGLLMAKFNHEPEGKLANDSQGLYLCAPRSNVAVPIPEPDLSAGVPKKTPKPRQKPKASKKEKEPRTAQGSLD